MPRKPKRRKWGSIRSVSRYKHILRWVENTPEGRVRRCHTFEGTEAEAQLWLDRKHVELADDGDKPVPTIGDAYEMWWRPNLERRLAAGKIKQRTFDMYARSWSRHAAARWNDVPATKVRPQDVQEWLLTLTQGEAKLCLVVLKGAMDMAVRFEAAESNKFDLPYDLPDKSRTRSKRVYSLDEAVSMMSTVRGTLVEAPYLLACFGSARTGESLGVRCSEIAEVEAFSISFAAVPVSRMMDAVGDAPVEHLKNRQSERTLLIPEPYGMRILELASSGGEWLADRGDGLPMNRSALDSAWGRIAGADRIPFANLRASWRTFAQYEWGVDHDTLELLMGHALPGVSGRHYIRPGIDDLARSFAEAYGSFLGKVR